MTVPREEWDRCKPWIEAALEYAGGSHTIEDVRELVEAGKVLLLTGENSALVVEIVQQPRLSVFHVWLAGGDLAELLAIEKTFDAMARTLGCSKISISGRAGWERVLRNYSRAHVELVRNVYG